ncbi:MAG TPA: transcription termination factor Rho [Opitutaceae bacterium]|nr:transcription termination factor Rho [Opitutaceae bacterium]
MAIPPKTDDDKPSARASAGETKKKRAATPRPRKTKAKPAPDSDGQLPLTPAPVAKREEPAPPPVRERERERAPEPERASDRVSRDEAATAAQRETFTPSTPPPSESRSDSSGSTPPQRDERENRENQGSRDVRDERDGNGSPPHQGGGQGGHHQAPHQGGGGGQGEWQDRGGGGGGQGGGRDFWKRNKRGKRGRHGGGGNWQQGGGGGGGGGGFHPREQHPPQPAPPSNAPVFGDLPNPSRFADLAALDTLAREISSGSDEPLWLNEIYAMPLAELTAYARKNGVTFEGAPNRRQLLQQIFAAASESRRPIRDKGYIDMTDRGAFVVHEHVNYRLYPEDPFLPESLIKRFGLKRGHQIDVLVQAPLPGDRCPSVLRIDSVMGDEPEAAARVTPFEELVPYYPLQRILLESEATQKDVSMRAVDILTPIGFGQRALIVAPPRTGKTVLLQNIANSITENSPHAKLILLLIDERPEEVTDFKRHTKGEVVSSTFDETPESHVHCAEMVIEKARRLVELGQHVVILLDSITRLARAYNALTGNQGKTMSGGLESNALQKPKRFFGSARNIEGGGSLTIIASALIDTGSRMDEIIFEEFKGTGNCELHLDRGLVERRIFPAINIDRSGTRKEELIYHPDELQRIYGLRRAMQGLGPIESMEMLITRLKKTKSNAEFLLSLAR